jgi:hypothetical protein
MATDTKEGKAPTPVPDFSGGENVFDEEDVWVDGPAWGVSREATPKEQIARKQYLEREEARARGEDPLSELEAEQRRRHPRERYTIHSDARGSEVLVVDHTTKTAHIERKFIGANRGGMRSVTGDLTVRIPVSDWSFEPTSKVSH